MARTCSCAIHSSVNQRLVGIDVGGTKMLAVAVDAANPGEIIDRRLVPTPSTSGEVISALIELARSMQVGDRLGIGLAGLVEDGDVLRAAPNLKCMIDVPVRDAIVDALGVDVSIDNDATCALVAEMEFGAARDVSDVVLVTLGTGIGGAVGLGGVVRRGAHGFAGEPGHMCVDPQGPLCVCGRHGCWERYASGAGLMWLASRAGMANRDRSRTVTGEELAVLAREGDDAARAVWDAFAEWLALGLANLADVLDPDLFVIGGGLVSVADLYLDRTRECFAQQVLGGRARTRTRILPAESGPAAGAIGAALLH